MLRDDADFFSTRYEDMVREPDQTWRDWIADAAAGRQKTLFVAEEGGRWLGVVGAFVRVNPREVQLISMWVDPRARGRGVARDLIRRRGRLDGRARIDAGRPLRPGGQRAGAGALPRAGFRATGDRAPGGGGRSAFKLVLAASVEDILR